VCSGVRDKPRKVLAILASTIGHAVVLLSGFFDLTPDALDLDVDLEFELVEVDLVELDKLQGEEEKPAEPVQAPPQPPPETPPLPPDPTAEKEKEQEKEKPVEPETPKRDLGQKRSTIDQLGPPNSTYHVLLSTKNIRKLPYAKLAMSVIAALPDYDFLVTSGGFDPLKDFDHIVIASPDLRSVTQTFLAVDYKVSRETMKQRIEKACEVQGETIEWIDEGGILRGNPKPNEGGDWDPRWFVLPQDNVAFYMREEFLAAITKEETGEEKTTANFISKMSKLKKFAQRIPTAGLQFEAHDLHAALKRKSTGKFELPDHLELTIEAQADPEINIVASFQSVVAAKEFMNWWDNEFRKLIDDNVAIRFWAGSLIDAIEVTRNEKDVQGWGELERAQTEMILKTIGAEVAEFQKGAAKKREAQKKAAAAKAAQEEPSDEPSGAKEETPAPKQDVSNEEAPAPTDEQAPEQPPE
jgi:hypothetical protein